MVPIAPLTSGWVPTRPAGAAVLPPGGTTGGADVPAPPAWTAAAAGCGPRGGAPSGRGAASGPTRVPHAAPLTRRATQPIARGDGLRCERRKGVFAQTSPVEIDDGRGPGTAQRPRTPAAARMPEQAAALVLLPPK